VPTIRELFPFGDIDDAVVAEAASRFPGLPAAEIGAGFQFGKAIVGALQYFSDLLDEAGLTPARWRLLMALTLQAPPEGGTIGELAGHLQVREPTVTATVDRLEHEDLVVRNRDEQDRRVVRVTLTPDGVAKVAGVIPRIATRFRAFVGELGGPETVRGLARQISAAHAGNREPANIERGDEST
jgi:DNA-binding MarR family transcriptional regulator